MKAVINSTFSVRGKPITSYYSYPVYSKEIEKTMSRQLEFLSQYDSFSLEMKITKGT